MKPNKVAVEVFTLLFMLYRPEKGGSFAI